MLDTLQDMERMKLSLASQICIKIRDNSDTERSFCNDSSSIEVHGCQSASKGTIGKIATLRCVSSSLNMLSQLNILPTLTDPTCDVQMSNTEYSDSPMESVRATFASPLMGESSWSLDKAGRRHSVGSSSKTGTMFDQLQARNSAGYATSRSQMGIAQVNPPSDFSESGPTGKRPWLESPATGNLKAKQLRTSFDSPLLFQGRLPEPTVRRQVDASTDLLVPKGINDGGSLSFEARKPWLTEGMPVETTPGCASQNVSEDDANGSHVKVSDLISRFEGRSSSTAAETGSRSNSVTRLVHDIVPINMEEKIKFWTRSPKVSTKSESSSVDPARVETAPTETSSIEASMVDDVVVMWDNDDSEPFASVAAWEDPTNQMNGYIADDLLKESLEVDEESDAVDSRVAIEDGRVEVAPEESGIAKCVAVEVHSSACSLPDNGTLQECLQVQETEADQDSDMDYLDVLCMLEMVRLRKILETVGELEKWKTNLEAENKELSCTIPINLKDMVDMNPKLTDLHSVVSSCSLTSGLEAMSDIEEIEDRAVEIVSVSDSEGGPMGRLMAYLDGMNGLEALFEDNDCLLLMDSVDGGGTLVERIQEADEWMSKAEELNREVERAKDTNMHLRMLADKFSEDRRR